MNSKAASFVIIITLISALSAKTWADSTSSQELVLRLHDAESRALSYSNRLKAAQSDQDAARFQSSAQYQTLLPRLSLQASYQYFNEIPKISIGPVASVNFGTNNVYSFGPVISYTLFDAFSSRRAYQASTLLEQARQQDRVATELQLLLNTRAAYVQVQLELEELKAIHDSWRLSEAQRRDVDSKFRAGAASRLDLVTAERSVLSYQIQFKQKQSELSSSVRDLLALLGDPRLDDPALQYPGPAEYSEVKFALKLDPLDSTLSEQLTLPLPPPDVVDPQTQSLIHQSESLSRSAQSQSARAYPLVQVSAGVSYNRPNVPNPPSYWQETAAATLSLPLFLGDPSHAQAAQLRSQADAVEFRASQRQEDVHRDYQKSMEAIRSLKEQKQLAIIDIKQSEEQARLYYTSYKAGKSNLIDVQNANVVALQAKVHASQIDAQIINQIIFLRSLSETKGSL
jgi:outer membrane protein TolC